MEPLFRIGFVTVIAYLLYGQNHDAVKQVEHITDFQLFVFTCLVIIIGLLVIGYDKN